MMGSGRRGVSICFATLKAFGVQALDSQRGRALPIVPTGTIRLTLSGGFLLFVRSPPQAAAKGRDRAGFLAEAELRFVAPHAVQHDGEVTGNG
jgi:hypothetical protein